MGFSVKSWKIMSDEIIERFNVCCFFLGLSEFLWINQCSIDLPSVSSYVVILYMIHLCKEYF